MAEFSAPIDALLPWTPSGRRLQLDNQDVKDMVAASSAMAFGVAIGYVGSGLTAVYDVVAVVSWLAQSGLRLAGTAVGYQLPPALQKEMPKLDEEFASYFTMFARQGQYVRKHACLYSAGTTLVTCTGPACQPAGTCALSRPLSLARKLARLPKPRPTSTKISSWSGTWQIRWSHIPKTH